jgi:hypothetical protein
MFCEKVQDLNEPTPFRDVFYIRGDLRIVRDDAPRRGRVVERGED